VPAPARKVSNKQRRQLRRQAWISLLRAADLLLHKQDMLMHYWVILRPQSNSSTAFGGAKYKFIYLSESQLVWNGDGILLDCIKVPAK
jgi:hypothetical protein